MKELENLKIRMKSPLPMRGVERKIYAANTLLLLSGVVVSLSLKDWQYFERIGSLIVIVGIAVAWRDLVGRVNWFKTMAERAIHAELIKLNSEQPKGLLNSSKIQAEEYEAICSELNKYHSSMSGLIAQLQHRLRTIEAITLILGTFVWGYGSVIGKLIYAFPA